MLPPEHKEFQNIFNKIFSSGTEYVKNLSVNTYRLDLIRDGQGDTFYFDVTKSAVIEKPEYYHSCRIELKSKNDGNNLWRVDITNKDSDVTYEFREDECGNIGDGVRLSVEYKTIVE